MILDEISRICSRWLLGAVAVAITAAAFGESQGHEFAIQRFALPSGGDVGQPSVAVDSREGFVVTWQERHADRAALWYAVIDHEGREVRRAQIAAGANWFVNWADFPSVVVLDNGDWMTHWLEKSAGSTYAYDVKLVRSRDRGRTWSAPMTPHRDGTRTQHGFVSLVPIRNDEVLVVWLDGRRGAASTSESNDHAHHEDEGPMTLRSAVINRAGERREERELDASTCSCCQTDAVRVGDRVVVVYRDRTASEIRDIAHMTRDQSGAWSPPAVVHADGWRIEGCPVNGPALAANRTRLLVVWPTGASGSMDIRYAIGPTGGRFSAPFSLSPGEQSLGRLDAAPWRSGYLVSWIGKAGGDAGLMLAAIDAGGALRQRVSVANVPMARISGNPRLATFGDRALLAWVQPDASGKNRQLTAALIVPAVGGGR
jgi:hypothetical protein